jgi:hypothetical protein
VLGRCFETQFAHGIDDASLHRFESVTDVRQGTVHDHVHGIVEIGLPGKLLQGHALGAFDADGCIGGGHINFTFSIL